MGRTTMETTSFLLALNLECALTVAVELENKRTPAHGQLSSIPGSWINWPLPTTQIYRYLTAQKVPFSNVNVMRAVR